MGTSEDDSKKQFEQDNSLLRESWAEFCDSLKQSGDLVFRDSGPQNSVSRATGMRLLARNISLAMQFEMENCNPDFPELLHYFDPLRKQGGDNTDALYVGSPINGQHSYRIWGQRGSAAYFAITVLEDGNTPWGGGVVATLLGENLKLDDDGNFELIVSPEPEPENFAGPGKNWMQSSPESYRITFRQFFADWLNEEPMTAQIECLSHALPHPHFTPQALAEGLQKSAHWVNSSVAYWATMIDKWKVQPNTFLSYGELEKNKIDFTPGGAPIIAFWQLPKDQALILRVQPPNAEYWAVEFGNYWWETMDYRYHFSSTNCHHARLERDGELIIVVSHEDLGANNWLDPCGHEEGYVTFRWIGSDSYPKPACKQLSVSELRTQHSGLLGKVSATERNADLKTRRQGITRRFGS